MYEENKTVENRKMSAYENSSVENYNRYY